MYTWVHLQNFFDKSSLVQQKLAISWINREHVSDGWAEYQLKFYRLDNYLTGYLH